MTDDNIARAKVLLAAAHDMLRQADRSPIVLDPMQIETHYDEADCDGHCLAMDIEHWFEEMGQPLQNAFA